MIEDMETRGDEAMPGVRGVEAPFLGRVGLKSVRTEFGGGDAR